VSSAIRRAKLRLGAEQVGGTKGFGREKKKGSMKRKNDDMYG